MAWLIYRCFIKQAASVKEGILTPLNLLNLQDIWMTRVQ